MSVPGFTASESGIDSPALATSFVAPVDGVFEGVGLVSDLPVSSAGCAEIVVSPVIPVVSSTFGVTGAELVSLGCSVVEATAGAVDGFSSFGADDSSDCGAIASDSSAFDADGAGASELGFEATGWSVVSALEGTLSVPGVDSPALDTSFVALVDGLFEVAGLDSAGAVPPAGRGEEDVLAVDSKVSSLGVTGAELVSLGCSTVEPTAGAVDGFSDSSE